jgi:hypothetical protein
VTELGRVASHFYVRAPSIEIFSERLKPHLRPEDVLAMMALSTEFESMAVRWVFGGGARVGGQDVLAMMALSTEFESMAVRWVFFRAACDAGRAFTSHVCGAKHTRTSTHARIPTPPPHPPARRRAPSWRR